MMKLLRLGCQMATVIRSASTATGKPLQVDQPVENVPFVVVMHVITREHIDSNAISIKAVPECSISRMHYKQVDMKKLPSDFYESMQGSCSDTCTVLGSAGHVLNPPAIPEECIDNCCECSHEGN